MANIYNAKNNEELREAVVDLCTEAIQLWRISTHSVKAPDAAERTVPPVPSPFRTVVVLGKDYDHLLEENGHKITYEGTQYVFTGAVTKNQYRYDTIGQMLNSHSACGWSGEVIDQLIYIKSNPLER